MQHLKRLTTLHLLTALPVAAQDAYLKFGGGVDLGIAKWAILVVILAVLGYLPFWFVTQKMKEKKNRSQAAKMDRARERYAAEREAELKERETHISGGEDKEEE